MIVHYEHMTGDEFKRIYKISGKKAPDFAKMLETHMGVKIERHNLYTQFDRRNKPIDKEYEEAVKKLPELAQHQLLVVNDQQSSPQSEGSEVVRILTETISVMKEVLLKGEKMSAAILDDNRHIKEEALLYRKMLTDGYEAGLLQWKGKKSA